MIHHQLECSGGSRILHFCVINFVFFYILTTFLIVNIFCEEAAELRLDHLLVLLLEGLVVVLLLALVERGDLRHDVLLLCAAVAGQERRGIVLINVYQVHLVHQVLLRLPGARSGLELVLFEILRLIAHAKQLLGGWLELFPYLWLGSYIGFANPMYLATLKLETLICLVCIDSTVRLIVIHFCGNLFIIYNILMNY